MDKKEIILKIKNVMRLIAIIQASKPLDDEYFNLTCEIENDLYDIIKDIEENKNE